jgi:hypothetical protein
VKFDWTAPTTDNGSPITAYKLSILNEASGLYVNNEAICNGSASAVITALSCTIPMT